MGKRKVLVVDDEVDICEPMKAILEREGCQVFTALKSEEAWDIFQRERPEACSIDIHMTDSAFDGLELLRKIREIDKDVLCIMFTVEEEKEIIEEAKRLGVSMYREKPVTVEEYHDLIKLLVGK